MIHGWIWKGLCWCAGRNCAEGGCERKLIQRTWRQGAVKHRGVLGNARARRHRASWEVGGPDAGGYLPCWACILGCIDRLQHLFSQEFNVSFAFRYLENGLASKRKGTCVKTLIFPSWPSWDIPCPTDCGGVVSICIDVWMGTDTTLLFIHYSAAFYFPGIFPPTKKYLWICYHVKIFLKLQLQSFSGEHL